MIVISRVLCKRLRNMIRRALNLSPSALQEYVTMSTGPQGLRVAASFGGFAVLYAEHTPLESSELHVTLGDLKAAEGNQDDLVTIAPQETGGTVLRWNDGVVPQQRLVESPQPAAIPELPPLPATFVENPATLCRAIADAYESTDDGSSRYALSCLQLRGEQGDLTATDGRHIFRHGGFRWGTDQDLLVRPTTVFGAKELGTDQPIQFGVGTDHAVLVVGPWTFWLPLEKEARFPRMDDVIPSPRRNHTAMVLSRRDTAFLLDNLPRLPGLPADHPVTIDLNGSVAIRSRSADEKSVVELRLSESQRVGEDVRISINRHYLQRAARLGFDRLEIYDADSPVVCRTEDRMYVWAPLSKEGIIPHSEQATIIASPQSSRRCPARRERPTAMSCSSSEHPPTPTTVNPESATAPATSLTPPAHKRCSATSSIMEEVLTLRVSLRDALTKTNELVRAVQRQRKQQRLMQSTLASLKQLQTVA